MSQLRIAPRLLLITLLALAVCTTSLADPRGYVDGSFFIDLADEDKELVEIALGGGLLRAVSQMLQSDPDAAEVVMDLRKVEAYQIGLREDAAKHALNQVLALEKTLMKSGWQRIARVREAGSHVIVLIDEEDGIVHGLVVMNYERDEPSIAFVNLLGKIDLASLTVVARKLDLPGLEHVRQD